ncbi:hypothetical protein CK203_104176 [Vitis vinifera]|uniref:Uncharacterized protein n=1 Tax=Vitis vinifera TaxID=29760 RepID=A0A438CUN9_VITVI|nr:hypothetical protein CK203_104176 [Vitis vinifera]
MVEPSPLGNPLGKRGSACVEVMTTLHGSILSPWRRAEGYVPSKSTIASTMGPLTRPFYLIEPHQPCRSVFVPNLHSPLWTKVRGRLTKASDQPDQRVDQRDINS